MDPGSPQRLAWVDEAVFDPDREIIDPHHHLWPLGEGMLYDVDALIADATGGHNIVQTVFVQCGAAQRRDGPAHLRPIGESEFVAAAQARYYHYAIEAFGPERCMFESNFPVDRVSVSSRVIWNALQKIAADCSDDE